MAAQDFSLLLNIAPDAPVASGGNFSSSDAFVDTFGSALTKQESGGKQLRPDGTPVTSSKGAIGKWQVMPDTAPEAARLAGVEFDDVKYRNDANYNETLGKAYLKKQFDTYQDPAKALAAYNAGPGALDRALATAEKAGTPNAWMRYLPRETQNYVPAIMGRAGKASGVNQGSYSDIKPRGPGATIGDIAKEAGASAVDSIGYIGQAFGEGMAAIANKATGTEDYEGKNLLQPVSEGIRNTMTEGGQRARTEEASIDGSVMDLLSGNATLPTTGDGWAMVAANGFGSLSTVFLPVLGPAGRVAKLTRAAEVATAAGDTAKAAQLVSEAQAASRAARVTGAVTEGATTGGAAAGDVRDSAAKSVAAMSHEQLMAEVPLYAEAFNKTGDEQQARGAVVNSAARWAGGLSAIAGIAGGAFNAKLIEDTLVHKGVSSIIGNSAKSRLGRGAVAGAGGSALEGGQETTEKVGQNAGENIALGRNAGDDVMRNTAGDFLGGALVGGPIGFGGGVVSRPSIPAHLQPVADKAAEGNSPLSEAAMAGNAGVLSQAAAASTPAEPAANVDPIAARVQAAVQTLETTDTLQKLRDLGPQMGADNLTSDFLYALQVARNPNSRPDQREAAINQVEQAIQWTTTGFTTPQEQRQQPGTAVALRENNAVGPVGQTEFFDPNTIDGEFVRTDNMIGGPKALTGPQRGLTTTGPQATTEPATAAEPTAPRQPVHGRAPIDASTEQQNVGAQTDVSRMSEVQAPRVEIPAGTGPAVLRKRAAVAKQLADNGFETVQRDGKDFFMVNSKTGQKFKLDGPADAQLARKAIKDRLDAIAHTAAASPKNDLKEPTQAQIDAGNYKKSDVIELNGMQIKIENPKDSFRRGVAPDGTPWESKMVHHYGEFQGTLGADGDKLDVFVGPRPDSQKVYVIDQKNADGTFDEHKVMMGFTSQEAAREGYLANYDKGWTGLGAITEMGVDEFKTWAKSRAAQKPAAQSGNPTSNGLEEDVAAEAKQDAPKVAEKAAGQFFYVNDGEKKHKLKIIKSGEMPKKPSAERTGKRRPLTQADASLIEKVAALLGKNVVFFEAQNGRLADGFVRQGEPNTIYVATETTVNPLAVFGHEFFHTLRETNPAAWDAISAVVSTKVTGAQRFRKDRYGKKVAEEKGAAALSTEVGGELEELVSDLGGNLLKDSKFWKEVFAKIEADNGTDAKGIIAKLSAALQRVLTKIVGAMNQPGFRADSFVKDLDEVRAALKDAMAQYLKDSGITQRAMAAEELKAKQQAKQADAKPKSEPASEINKSTDRTADEYAEVEAKYKGTDAWMKAPNGKPTNLNERQWVQVRTPAFKAWFGDWEKYAGMQGGVWNDSNNEVSKAVDKNGEPLVVYHGTNKGGFAEFNKPGGERRGDLGIFTTPNLAMAQTYYSRRGGEIDLSPVSQSDLEELGYGFDVADDGTLDVTDPNGYTVDGPSSNDFKFASIKDAVAQINQEGDFNNEREESGYYALFVNIRNPAESDFEGANWEGSRQDQYNVVNDDGEFIPDMNGRTVFNSYDEAEAVRDANPRTTIEGAADHYETTDDVVRGAIDQGYDGAYIHNVVDAGPGGGPYIDEPSDIFVALSPEQLKSASFNSGEFSDETGDIRKTTDRQYKLDIEREERTNAKAARLSDTEQAAIEKDGKELGLSAKQIKALSDDARRIKKQFPATQGWAPLTVVGVELKTNESGEPIAGSEKPKFQAIAYGFNVPPGMTRAPAKVDEAWLNKVADKFRGLVLDIYDRAEKGDKNAQIIIGHQTWYRNVAEVLRREYGGAGDMLADVLGATSPNTPVDTNWRFSVEIMRRFMAGDFNDQLKKFAKYIDDGGDASKYPAADKIRQVSGKLYGMNSTNAMKALVDMWRVIEPGQAPKARNFALNLIGQSNMATIDVWAARMLRRAANQVRGADLPRIPPAAESGVSGVWNANSTKVTGAFGFGAEVMDKVSKDLERRGIKVTPPDLQAIAWFAEKELWGQKGWTTKTGEGGSFEENIEATPVERYLAGWSIQQGEKVPGMDESSVVQARVLSMLIGDDSVVAARVMPTSGLYGGALEASFDTEWTATKGQHDPSLVMAEIAKIAQENEQLDVFVSKVVGPKEDNPNARPGVEIYFKSATALEKALPILKKFTGKGQDGFTMMVDPRATPNSVTGEQFIGVRLQYVPEISMRWDPQLRRKLLAPGGIERVLKGKQQLLSDIAAEVGAMDGVAFATMQKYDTVVVGKENYDEYIDRGLEGGYRAAGGQAWFGQQIRSGLEGAAARLRGDIRQDGAGGVSDAGSRLLTQVAGGPDSGPVLNARGIRRSPERVAVQGGQDQRSRGREEDGSLNGLPRNFTVDGIEISASHWAPAESVARLYMAEAGLPYNPPSKYAKVDLQRATRIAAEYDKLKHSPQDPQVKAAYAALVEETAAQYQAVVDSGLTVEFIDFANQGDPYAASPRLMTEDVRRNNHMYVFSTRDGFGSDAEFDPIDNPLLAETDFIISGKKALVNDLFRVVHDYFGHVKEGVGFRADGEENTWRAHSAMFSPLAQRALTTETRGQNSWVNYGPHGESNRKSTAGDTHYADQKVGLLPEWVSEDGKTDEPTYNQRVSALKDLISCLKK